MQNYMFCARYILLHMQKHILLQNIYIYICNRLAFYDEARTTETTRDHGDTVVSFAYDYMYSLLL